LVDEGFAPAFLSEIGYDRRLERILPLLDELKFMETANEIMTLYVRDGYEQWRKGDAVTIIWEFAADLRENADVRMEVGLMKALVNPAITNPGLGVDIVRVVTSHVRDCSARAYARPPPIPKKAMEKVEKLFAFVNFARCFHRLREYIPLVKLHLDNGVNDTIERLSWKLRNTELAPLARPKLSKREEALITREDRLLSENTELSRKYLKEKAKVESLLLDRRQLETESAYQAALIEALRLQVCRLRGRLAGEPEANMPQEPDLGGMNARLIRENSAMRQKVQRVIHMVTEAEGRLAAAKAML
jgi:hypothetical protein